MAADRAMSSGTDDLSRLVRHVHAPYPPEPPKAHFLVSLAVSGARRFGARPRPTPHLTAGADVEKTQYEYDQAAGFLATIAPWTPPDLMTGRTVLDLGCGWGGKAVYFAEALRPERIEGFDLPGVFEPAVPLEFARARGVSGCGFRTGRAEAVPFDEAAFDVVLCEDVLEHVQDPGQTLRECARVLRSGGCLVALFPSFRMIDAHHLDRALAWPALHYVFSLKTWAAGLNHYLLAHQDEVHFEPFSEVVETAFHPCVTRDLNGMSFRQFGALGGQSGLATETLRMLPRPTPDNGRSVWLKRLYRRLCRTRLLAEPLCQRVLYVGRKP